MIITLSGKAGSGKSTIARQLSLKLGLKHYSVGDVMRQMAAERGIPLLELNKLAEKDQSIDKELDGRLAKLGETEHDFVIDGRLAAFFIPRADARIFLEADSRTRAERILRAQRSDERTETFEETLANMERREESERKRYKHYYDVDYTDRKLYTDIVDTTTLPLDRLIDSIIAIVKKRGQKGKKKG